MNKLILLLIPFLAGCESLERLTEGASHQPPSIIQYGDPHIVQGVTLFDYEYVEGIPVEGRTITVKVKRPGEESFTPISQYEFNTKNNPSSFGVIFGKRVVETGGIIYVLWPHQPVAPQGTEYIIRSQTNG